MNPDDPCKLLDKFNTMLKSDKEKFVKEFARKLLDYGGHNDKNPTINNHMPDSYEKDGDLDGAWDSEGAPDGVIYVDLDDHTSGEQLINTVYHEVLHADTYYVTNRNTDDTDSKSFYFDTGDGREIQMPSHDDIYRMSKELTDLMKKTCKEKKKKKSNYAGKKNMPAGDWETPKK